MSQAPDTLPNMNDERWSHLSSDKLEAELRDREAHKAALTAEQAGIVAELDRRQTPTAHGYRSMHDWVAGRVDVDRWTARRLVALSRLDLADVWRDLADGEITADRALAEAKLMRAGADERVRRASRGWNVDGVHRLAERHRRFTRADEEEAFDRRFVSLQPNLDESLWKLAGSLPGLLGQMVDRALDHLADRLPDGPDGRGTAGQRRADALATMAADAIDPSSGQEREPLPVMATVFVDGMLAAATRGEAGAEVIGGPRVGPNTLELILCGGRVEVDTSGATPLGVGPARRAVPPRLRRFVIARDGGMCTADGCGSRHRLQVHHIVPRSKGGTDDPAGLGTFCWYHHMIVIHGRGFRIDPDSPPQRRRFRAPEGRDPPGSRG